MCRSGKLASLSTFLPPFLVRLTVCVNALSVKAM